MTSLKEEGKEGKPLILLQVECRQYLQLMGICVTGISVHTRKKLEAINAMR